MTFVYTVCAYGISLLIGMGSSISIHNDTEVALNIALSQVGPLYYKNFVLPEDSVTFSVGKVWFTLEGTVWNGDNEYNGKQIAQSIIECTLEAVTLFMIVVGRFGWLTRAQIAHKTDFTENFSKAMNEVKVVHESEITEKLLSRIYSGSAIHLPGLYCGSDRRISISGGPKYEKSKDGKTFDRNTAPNSKPNGENREQRFNRRNRDDTNKSQSTQQYNGNTTNNQSGNKNNQSEQNSNRRNDDRPPRRVNNYNDRGNDRSNNDRNDRRGGGDGQRRTFEGRGKREFDRQSGSEKTGVKAIDKREGGGAHNCGTHKQDIEDLNKTNSEFDPEKETKEDGTAEGNGNKDEAETQSPAEEETKEITLDEWKAQRAIRAKPQFNIRKAGEGEDTSQCKKMIALQNRKKKATDDENSDDELEYEPSMYPQRVGRQKHVLDIEFHFNDGRRGGLNRGREGHPRVGGAGGGGGGGPNSAGERGERRGPNRNRGERGDRGDRQENDGNERPDVDRPARPPRERRDDDRRERRAPYGDDRRGGHGQNAPKVDDEHDFPSLN